MGKYGTPALVRSHIHLLQAVPWPFPSQTSFHTGSISRDSVPLWQVRLAAALPAGVSGTDSSSGPIPHWQRFPRFSAVVAGPSRSSPSGRRLWYGFLIRSISTLAAYPAIQCRCGRSVSQQPFRQASLVRIPRPVPFHTGSVSRDSVPLWQVRLAAAFLIGFLVRIPHPVPFHTGSVSRDSVLLWKKRHGKNLKELFRKI